MKKNAFLIAGLFAVQQFSAQETQLPVTIISLKEFHISKPVSEFPSTQATTDIDDEDRKESSDRAHRLTQTFVKSAADGPEYANDPNSIQTKMGQRPSPGTKANWAGQDGGYWPQDPSGAASANYYVQAVNATPVKIYSKTGATISSFDMGTALFGTSTIDGGDPNVLYDKYADRWVITQLDDFFGSNPNDFHIAISTTNNPGGSYYVYTYTNTGFPDYLKFSIWQNGYFMCMNDASSTGSTSTNTVYAFERAQMLLGNPSAKFIAATYTGGLNSGFYCPLPADADGTLPPSTSVLPFFSYSDNAWGTGAVDGIKIWNVTVNWVPATPTISVATPITVPTAAFDASYSSAWNDISQPTPATQKLDGIGGVCTYRAQWRKWTGYNSVVLNWGVKISGTQRSIKWVELRQDQTTLVWSLFQEGTYTPDTKSRWLGSIAMDDNGSIALCYARCSATAGDYMGLGYTGRLKTDPAGTMSFAETIAIAGTGSQSGTAGNRVGDYSHTSVDPDGITFWHTGMYMGGASGSGASRTRIYSFQLPVPPTGISENPNDVQLTAFQSEGTINVNATKLPSNDDYAVDLFDINGSQISGQKITPTSNSFKTTIDVNGLAAGVYLVRIGTPNFQRVIKLSVIK